MRENICDWELERSKSNSKFSDKNIWTIINASFYVALSSYEWLKITTHHHISEMKIRNTKKKKKRQTRVYFDYWKHERRFFSRLRFWTWVNLVFSHKYDFCFFYYSEIVVASWGSITIMSAVQLNCWKSGFTLIFDVKKMCRPSISILSNVKSQCMNTCLVGLA